jgi:predicted RNase H-like HicB family nuclease
MAKAIKYIYWKEGKMWLGYLEEFPDYWSQGSNRKELQKNLKDIFEELTSGRIPGVRRAAELQIA